jgi:hypothetical protein
MTQSSRQRCQNVIAGFVLVQIPPQVAQILCNYRNPTTVTLVINPFILVMEEVHHKGGFPVLAISVNRKKISVYLSLMASTVVGAQLSGGEESVTVGSYSNFPKE